MLTKGFARVEPLWAEHDTVRGVGGVGVGKGGVGVEGGGGGLGEVVAWRWGLDCPLT